ncbi:rRNA methyltransferase 1, mitochondrial isoform X2 [Lepisosteus oculatus]|uniref:rRNA methyltransferase 1, mitochondrial isoform X2 n=1 Tax=Lepisosteus oculatus TaxID=7918 RepID=UPI00371E8E1D
MRLWLGRSAPVLCVSSLNRATGVICESITRSPPWQSYHASLPHLSARDKDGGSRRGPGGGARDGYGAPCRLGGQSERSGVGQPTSRKSMRFGGSATADLGCRTGSRLSSELRNLSEEDFPRRKPKARGEKAPAEAELRGTEIVFGAAPCLLALSQGRRRLCRLFVKQGLALQRPDLQQACRQAQSKQVEVQQVNRKELDRLASGRVHQGLCLEASPLGYQTDDPALEGEPGRDSAGPPLWLVLDGIQDPMNLGAILRSAYFLGVDRIASSLRNSCPLTPVVSKASSGAMEVLEVYGYDSLADVLKAKLSRGWHVVGTVGAAEADMGIPVLSCSEFQQTKPTLLVLVPQEAQLLPRA